MRREILEVTCDECGLIARFETFCGGMDGLTFTNHPIGDAHAPRLAAAALRGWEVIPLHRSLPDVRQRAD